jgi:hypothetical protein
LPLRAGRSCDGCAFDDSVSVVAQVTALEVEGALCVARGLYLLSEGHRRVFRDVRAGQRPHGDDDVQDQGYDEGDDEPPRESRVFRLYRGIGLSMSSPVLLALRL